MAALGSFKVIGLDEVSITKNHCTFGKGIRNFFIKNKIYNLVIVLDFNQDAIIFLDGRGEGYPLNFNIAPNSAKILSTIQKFIIDEMDIRYQLKKFKERSLIIENVPLKNFILMVNGGPYARLNVKDKIIVFGSDARRYLKLKPSDLLLNPPQETIPVIQSQNNHTISMPVNVETSRPHKSQSVPTITGQQSQNNLVKPQKKIDKAIPDKEIGQTSNINPARKYQPTPEHIEEIDKAYSKMILGE